MLNAEEKIKSRIHVIDLLKGVGIILVVIGHALGGLIDANVTPKFDWFRPLFAVIYMFHMPLFFFISGIFVIKRLEVNEGQFKNGLLKKIVWPYLFWSVIQTLIIVLAGNLVNHPVDNLHMNLVKIFFHPPSQFWFLYALFLMHFFALVFLKKFSKGIFVALGLIIFLIGELDVLPYILNLTANMLMYYVLGVMLGERLLASLNRDVKLKFSQLATILVMPFLVFGSYKFAINLGVDSSWPEQAASIFNDVNGLHNFATALVVIFSLFAIGAKLVAFAPKWLLFVGRISMPIFILHVIFVAGIRIILLKFFPNIQPEFLLVLLSFVGVLLPSMIYIISEKLNINRLIGFN